MKRAGVRVMSNRPISQLRRTNGVYFTGHKRGIRIENANSRRITTDTRRRPFETTTASCIPNKLAAQFPGRVKLQSLSLSLSPLPFSRVCKSRFIFLSFHLQLRKPSSPSLRYATKFPLFAVYSFHDLFTPFYWNFARALDFGQWLNYRSKMDTFQIPGNFVTSNETRKRKISIREIVYRF